MYMDPSLPRRAGSAAGGSRNIYMVGFPCLLFNRFFSCKDFELRELQPPLGIADFRR